MGTGDEVKAVHDDSILDAAVAGLPCPPLPGELGERVGLVARGELAPPPGLARRSAGPREALVPELLMSAAVIGTADTVRLVESVFGEVSPDAAGDRPKR